MVEYANAAFESRRPARTKLWTALTLAIFAAIAAGPSHGSMTALQ